MKYQSQRGVALVITLIMLSVITFLTVAFLAISRRDRASVTTSLNQTDARFMADTAFARMQAELTARMMSQNSLLTYDVMLTTNYINPLGFNPASGIRTNLTNVNYDFYSTSGTELDRDDHAQNIANLFYDPRPPVFVRTNNNTDLDFRFFLDYNRNGQFETNGSQPVIIDESGTLLRDANGVVFKNFLGEPEWIGVLQNPEYPHSPTNRFIGRYLYLALPIGKTLDWNHIHNYAKGDIGRPAAMPGNGDGFSRNQGVGSWEINLGAFLQDLSVTMYPTNPVGVSYNYFPGVANANTGLAFNDAVSILGFRYRNNFNNLSSVDQFFSGSGNIPFQTDLIDGYSTAPVLTAPFNNTTDPDNGLTTRPWSGSNNRTSFFEPQELFDPNKTSPLFVQRLTNSVARTNSYDRYTFSRLLEQIGTGSEPEVFGKININYSNSPTSRVVNTNFVEWTPLQFFTNVASRLIKDNLTSIVNNGVTNWYLFYDGNTNYNRVNPNFGLTNIQIYPTNEYSAPLHRLLQVAANVYDATTTNKYPTVFRPRIQGSGTEAKIFEFVVETNSQFAADYFSRPFQDRTNIITNPDDLVWGVPLVIGAKKGFPSFSKFIAQTVVQVSRNLKIEKTALGALPSVTNQMLTLGISNVFAMEAWNSYTNAYTNSMRLIMTNVTSMVLTNENNTIIWPTGNQATNFGFGNVPGLVAAVWPSVVSKQSAFVVPLFTNAVFLKDSKFLEGQIPAFSTNLSSFPTDRSYPVPRWGMVMTNRLVYALIDTSEPMGRVIDFVNLDDMTSHIEISSELLGNSWNAPAPGGDPNILAAIWRTNRVGDSSLVTAPTLGMEKQIRISLGDPTPASIDDVWNNYNSKEPPGSREKAAIEFALFMEMTPLVPLPAGVTVEKPTNLVWQTPFNPTRKVAQTTYWQINDPLVHYTVGDLTDALQTNTVESIAPVTAAIPPLKLRKISDRYRPWGRPKGGEGSEPGAAGATEDTDYAYDFRVKDPRVRWSDDWNFPTNKFANIGWLGRVHRGTPWQTIYLKAGAITNRPYGNNSPVQDWSMWAGHRESNPTNDWKLLDVFTVAANDNAARGLLSVNQTNQAAWSAVLSGVVALTNNLTDAQAGSRKGHSTFASFQSAVIQPGNAISNIVSQINAYRATRPNGTFSSVGEILGVPGLSVIQTNGIIDSSPFLNVTNYSFVGGKKTANATRNKNQRFYGMTDEAYERIPSQIMSLLKLGEPRYVVYSYGQSLKPAALNALYLKQPLFNLCTNYQITGEMVTRTVLRVEGTPQNPKTVIESYNVLSE